jgi:hypothetical protein
MEFTKHIINPKIHQIMTMKISKINPHQNSTFRTDDKYESILKEIVRELSPEIPEEVDIIERFELAVNAWNMASAYRVFSEAPNHETVSESAFSEAQQKIMNKMVDYILIKWPSDTLFIDQFNMLKMESDVRIQVATIEKEEFLAKVAVYEFEKQMEKEFEKQMEESFERQMEKEYERRMERELETDFFDLEFREGFVNRTALRIIPLKPYMDWVKNMDPAFYQHYHLDKNHYNVYLVEADDIEKWLKAYFDRIFELELGYCDIEGDHWPRNRTYKMFKKWFSVEITNLIYDLSETPLKKGF